MNLDDNLAWETFWATVATIVLLPVSWLLWRKLPTTRGQRAGRQRAVPWTLPDMFLVLFLAELWPILSWVCWQALLGDPAENDKSIRGLLVQMVASPLLLVSAIAALHYIEFARRELTGEDGTATYPLSITLGQMGLLWHRPWYNLGCAAVLGLGLIPAVHCTYGVTLLVYRACCDALPPDPLKQLVQTHDTTATWILLLVAVLLVAPLVEEWLFRGILQTWVAQSTVRGHGLMIACFVVLLFRTEHVLEKALFVACLVPGYCCAPALFRWRWPSDPAAVLPPWRDYFDLSVDDLGFRRVRAVYASALLFALGHTWPNAIPIFVFGLGLGALAMRTQSLLASIALHMLLNGLSCLLLALDQ